MTKIGYQRDLAYVHDVGFTDFVLSAAPALLRRMRDGGIRKGLVVDLGCGSGRWAKMLTGAGYDVLGIDLSPDMIRLARRHAPQARFAVASLLEARIPSCVAVTAIGEAVNYAFVRNSEAELARLFQRVHAALRPGGLFLFDAAGPGQMRGSPPRAWMEGADWSLLLEREEDRERQLLTRRIVAFRKIGQRYRRSEEVHRLRLYAPSLIARELRRAGFKVQTSHSYTQRLFRHGLTAFVARKPSGRS